MMRIIEQSCGFPLVAMLVFCVGCDSTPVDTHDPAAATSPVELNAPAFVTVDDAKQALRDGDQSLAHDIAQRILILDPENLDAGLVLVSLSVGRSKPKAAAQLLIQLADSHPSQQPQLRAQAAELFFQSGDAERAIAILQAVVEKRPLMLGIRRHFADMLNSRGFRFDANEHLRYLAGRVTLTPRELTGLVNPLLTWGTFAEKPNIDDPQPIIRWGTLNVVAALRANGDVRDALRLIQRSDLLQQKHPAAVAMHGWLLAANQDFDALERWAINADDACTRYPAYWIGMGNLMLHLGHESAVTCFTQALRREPNAMEAAVGLAQAFAARGKSEWVEKVKQRQKSINESQALAFKIGSTGNADPLLGVEMGRVMNSIGRPMESLAWQESLYSIIAPGAPQLDVLRQHKSQLLQRLPLGQDASAIICGINGSQLVSIDPVLAKLRQDTSLDSNRLAPTKKVPGDLITAEPATPVFTDIAASVGIKTRLLNAVIPVDKEFRLFEALGSGVACLDFDRDGNVDLYLGQAGSDPPLGLSKESNQLMRNRDNRFHNVTERSHSKDFGYTHGVTAGDWNQDGFPDLVIGNVGVNQMLINQGDGTFRPASIDSGQLTTDWNQPMFTTSIALADLTGDSIPDLFEANYVDDPSAYNAIEYNDDGTPIVLPGPKHFTAAIDRIFITATDGKLVLKSLGSSDTVASTGLGLLITDLDDDRHNEVFVANDQNPNQLWKYKPAETKSQWMNMAIARGCAYGTGGKPFACMGVAAADYDRNGRLDLHVTNFSGECSNLYLQSASGIFVDRAIAYRLDESTVPMVGFGTQAIDYDNNANIDLLIGNGHIEDFQFKGKPFRMPTQILARQGNRFIAQTVGGDPDYWGKLHLGRSVVRLDWNHDGRVDVGVTDLKDDFALLENRTLADGHFVQLELVGTRSERDAIGATVIIQAGDQTFVSVVQTGDGYMCRNEPVLFLGLGEATAIDRLAVRWPSGMDQVFEDVSVDQRLLITEGQEETWQSW